MEQIVIYLLLVQKLINLKQNILPLHLGNILRDLLVNHMKNIRLNCYFYDFSTDYDAIAVDNTLNIRQYLMKTIG